MCDVHIYVSKYYVKDQTNVLEIIFFFDIFIVWEHIIVICDDKYVQSPFVNRYSFYNIIFSTYSISFVPVKLLRNNVQINQQIIMTIKISYLPHGFRILIGNNFNNLPRLETNQRWKLNRRLTA